MPILSPLVFLAVGLAIVLAYNAWQWRDDRSLALRVGKEPKLPISLNSTPRVSILVAAWNEASLIDKHFQSVASLRYPNVEHIVSAGGDDQTWDLARRHAGPATIVLPQLRAQGKQAALRSCLEAASGEIIYLTDADCLVDDDSFERTLEPLINMGEAVATGSCRPLRSQRGNAFVMLRWFTDLYGQARWGLHIIGILGRNAAIQRTALTASGGFDAEISIGTDYFLSKLLLAKGYRIRNVPQSVVETAYSIGVRSYRPRAQRWMRNLVLHGLRFRAYREAAGSLAASMFGLGMLALGVLAVAYRGWALVLWLVVFGHVLLSRWRYIRFGEIVSNSPFPRSGYFGVPIFALTDFGVWALALTQYLVPAWRTRW